MTAPDIPSGGPLGVCVHGVSFMRRCEQCAYGVSKLSLQERAQLIEYIEYIEHAPGRLAAYAQARAVELAEVRHALNIRTLERDTLAADMRRLAERGTHHDLTPTRMLPKTERECLIDSTWEAYLKSADESVRRVARQALESIK